MKANYLDYSETNSFSPAIIRYLENDPDLEPFCSFRADIDGFGKLIKKKQIKPTASFLSLFLRNNMQGLNKTLTRLSLITSTSFNTKKLSL